MTSLEPDFVKGSLTTTFITMPKDQNKKDIAQDKVRINKEVSKE